MGIAIRALGVDPRGEAEPAAARPRPDAVATIVASVMQQGDVRRGAEDDEIGPDDARALLRAWLDSVGLEDLTARQLLELLQGDGFDHRDLLRRARAAHERRLAGATQELLRAAARAGAGRTPILPPWARRSSTPCCRSCPTSPPPPSSAASAAS